MSRFRKWFAKASRARRRAPLAVQALETRCLMASSLTASLNSGVLRIEGTDGPDSIVVRSSVTRISSSLGGRLIALDVPVTSIDGLGQSFGTGSVQRIEI